MTHLKFSVTSQCHKTTILYIVFKNEKSKLAWYRSMTRADRSHFFRLRLRSCSKLFESGSGSGFGYSSNLRIRLLFRLQLQSSIKP